VNKAGRVSTRESQNYGGRETTRPDGKGVHIQVRSSGVSGKVRLALVPDYEKETHDREAQLDILHRLFNLSSLGSATPF